MNMLQRFLGDKPARFVESDGDFWVVAADIVAALGLDNTTRALSRVPEHHKRRSIQSEVESFTLTSSKGKTRSQLPTLVSEVGAYILIMKSRTPLADAMIDKAAEIFKELRKHGFYSINAPVVGLVAIARAYDKMTPAIADLWVQQCELQPVGYSINADTGKLSSMYLLADVEAAFSHARRTKTSIGLRPYSGEWHAGGIPKKILPLSTRERHQKARAELAAQRAEEEAAHQKRLDDWDKEHGILPN